MAETGANSFKIPGLCFSECAHNSKVTTFACSREPPKPEDFPTISQNPSMPIHPTLKAISLLRLAVTTLHSRIKKEVARLTWCVLNLKNPSEGICSRPWTFWIWGQFSISNVCCSRTAKRDFERKRIWACSVHKKVFWCQCKNEIKQDWCVFWYFHWYRGQNEVELSLYNKKIPLSPI